MRSSCGLTLAAISQYNPDVLKRHAARALPLAFFAMHEKGEPISVYQHSYDYLFTREF